MKEKRIILVDCDNFYASCEKIFNPSIANEPVVVMSNNDGCVISRSPEARKMGIKMGVPVFELGPALLARLTLFSANYPLYGDISSRVINCLNHFAPDPEVYSIDEAFLDVSGIQPDNSNALLCNIRNTVNQWTGIPVTVSMAPNKTLAKAGNYLAKKDLTPGGTCNYFAQPDPEAFLAKVPLEEVWGIGEQYTRMFNEHGIFTALDLSRCDPFFARKMSNVMVQKIITELNGGYCFPLNENPPVKKEICISRSFGRTLETLDELLEATSNFAVRLGEKLRDSEQLAGSLIVFIMTSRFTPSPRYANYSMVRFEPATQDTGLLIQAMGRVVKELFKPGYKYKKSGVIAGEIVSALSGQQYLDFKGTRKEEKKLGQIVDSINKRQGKGSLRFAIQGFDDRWKMQQEKLSPRCTTRWDEIPVVGMDG